jgi:hypothetical protein
VNYELRDKLRAILASPDEFAAWLATAEAPLDPGKDLFGDPGQSRTCPLALYVGARLGPGYFVQVSDGVMAWRAGDYMTTRARVYGPDWADRFVQNIDNTSSGRRRKRQVSRRIARRVLKEALG